MMAEEYLMQRKTLEMYDQPPTALAEMVLVAAL
jgi:hypothetical protein